LQAKPHAPQFWKDESEALEPVRLTHVVPQQRWELAQVGEHMPGPASTPAAGTQVPP